MNKSQLKQIIKEIVNEVQWDLQTPEGQAKTQAGVEKRIGAQLDTLHKKIGDDKRRKQAEPILNKKPFKKPFNEYNSAENEVDMSNPEENLEVKIAKEILKLTQWAGTEKNQEAWDEVEKLANQLLKMHGIL